MKRFISFISVLVCLSIVLSVAPSAFAAGNELALGNNALTLGVVHSYTVEADGVLQLRFHEVYYGTRGGVHEGNLHRWLDFLVNGTAVDSFNNTLEVSAGDVVTVQMVSRDGDMSYIAQLFLTFTPAEDSGGDDGVSRMTVSDAAALRGEEVVLTVTLANNPGLTNGKITVDYDAAGLEFVGFNFDETPEEVLTMSNPGKAMMNFAAALDYAEDGVFFAIVLRVKDDAAEGDYAVGLTINQLKNDAEENVAFEVVAGNVSVHVCNPVPVEEVPATTTSPGVKAHSKCACGRLYIDGVEVTEEDLVIPMLGQMIVSSVEDARQGEEIVLTVSLVNNPGFTNGKITVDYDAAGLEFVGFNFDETPEEFLTMSNPELARMNFIAAADYAEDVVFFSIVLRVKDDAADGSYTVGLTINKLENNAEENVGFAVVAGAVTLHTCTAGEPVHENVVEATCTTDGSYDEVVYCTDCGKELSRKTVVVEALGHTEAEAVKENVVEATCTTDGGYDEVVYCSVCDEELSREHVVVEATGHEMGQWYVYRASTGTVKGEKRSDCAHCDYYESELLPYLGDVNGDDKVDTTDAKLIMQYDLGLIGEEDLDLSVGDVNGDGKINTTDAKLIMQLDLKLIEDFPGAGG